MSSELLQNLAKAIDSIPDPLFKQGVAHSYHGMVVLVPLGLNFRRSQCEITGKMPSPNS